MATPRRDEGQCVARVLGHLGATALLVALSACSAEQYKESADAEVYGILADKKGLVESADAPFTIERQIIALKAVGFEGLVEDLRRAKPPEPIIEPLEADGDASEAGRDKPEEEEAGAEGAAGVEPTDEQKLPTPGAGDDRDAAPIPGQRSATAIAGEPNATAVSDGAGGSIAPLGPDECGPPAPGVDMPIVGAADGTTTGAPVIRARVLNLDDTLRLAFANNRGYQGQKEAVYLSALSLTLARWQFAPRFLGIITGNVDVDGSGRSSGSTTSNFGWNQLFANGARLSVSLFNNFFRFLKGRREDVATSLISASITQPILRGFGSAIVTEPLTQAERDVLYQLRSLERFRRSFVVEVASEFYRVLQARNRVTNEYLNWQSLVNNFDRTRERARAELVPKFEVDQVEQQELQAQNRFLVAVEDYESLVDSFKVTLDIPVDAAAAFDQSELAELENEVSDSLEVRMKDAIAVALERRLDLLTARDRQEDAARQVGLAADALRTQLDLAISGSLPSESNDRGSQTPVKFDSKDVTYGVGFDMDLPFDRRAERNQYMATLIAADREARELDLFEDNVRVNVRDAHRRLLRERSTLDISKASVELATARVESTIALQDAGRVETRDVLDSQSALIDSKNAYTQALINLTIAKTGVPP